MRRFIIVVVCVKAWFYSILFYFILFYFISFLPNCVIASANTRQKTRIAQGKNGNKENEVSEASAVKSRSEQETK